MFNHPKKTLSFFFLDAWIEKCSPSKISRNPQTADQEPGTMTTFLAPKSIPTKPMAETSLTSCRPFAPGPAAALLPSVPKPPRRTLPWSRNRELGRNLPIELGYRTWMNMVQSSCTSMLLLHAVSSIATCGTTLSTCHAQTGWSLVVFKAFKAPSRNWPDGFFRSPFQVIDTLLFNILAIYGNGIEQSSMIFQAINFHG